MRKVTFSTSLCIPVINDGAIASSETGEGRFIPVVVLDFSNHKEFLNMVYVQQNTPPGDVVTTWGFKKFNSRYAYLDLKFTKPSEVDIVIELDLQNQSALADGIVQARGVYLQPSEFGKRVFEGMDLPKIMIEVPAPTEYPDWDKILLINITKKIRKSGLSKKAAKKAAAEHLKRMREIWSGRMKNA